MIVHSHAKINLFLKIKGRRKDGFHNIETVFQTVSLKDTMEILLEGSGVRIECDRHDIPKDRENIISKTIHALRREGYDIPAMKITLRKRIPPGSGLGGGSSNAAMIIMAINRMLNYRMSGHFMQSVARSLGSDVPFFLWGGTASGRGRGDEIFPLPDLQTLWVALATFQQKIETAGAYAEIGSLLTEKENNNNITQFIYSIFKGRPDFALVENDFEKLAFRLIGDLREVRKIFRMNGAMCTLLTGSGSAFYGIFERRRDAERAASIVKERTICMQCFVCATVGSADYQTALRG